MTIITKPYNNILPIIKKEYFLFLLLLFCISPLFSQQKIISGFIYDHISGEPIPQVSVSIEGVENVSFTDERGGFILIIPEQDKKIIFKGFEGFKVKKISYKNEIYIINLIFLERDYYQLSLSGLKELHVVSASRVEESLEDAAANITIISRQEIQERGYQTLVEVCEDLPGFDFFVFNDGGGEYPTYNMHRGIGSVGNTKILIMVDGIVQNNISFNWSQLWTYENMFMDLERIEVIAGPSSALYGGQAVSGVINFITRNNFNGVEAKSSFGSNFTRGFDIFAGHTFENQTNISLSLHKYNTEGDMGNRYDPGGYFHNISYPMYVLQDYDDEGYYVENALHPKGGQEIPGGFQNWNNSYSIRAKLNTKNFELGMYYWDKNGGSGSYENGYEYNVMDKDYQTHMNGYHIYAKNKLRISKKLELHSDLVFRSTNVLPTTGFKYHYRFPNLTKNYVAYAYQAYIEEMAVYKINYKSSILFGLKYTNNYKSDRVVSLGYFPENTSSTESSWMYANSGLGLNIQQHYPFEIVPEVALYGLWNFTPGTKFKFSMGLRYDQSAEIGQIIAPRLNTIYHINSKNSLKFMLGNAFKQPSFFELNDEFRGNPDLISEQITTYELEYNSEVFDALINYKMNVFFSDIRHLISIVSDTSLFYGQQFRNVSDSYISGFVLDLRVSPHQQIKFYSNYIFMLGKKEGESSWKQIETTAMHKLNMGVNWHLFNNKLTIDARANIVGKRKAQESNVWLHKYEEGYAPSYTKINLTVSYRFLEAFTAQLIINNLLSEQYYGVGRESGSAMVDNYHYIDNINPAGFIPAYHPQPGRSFLLNLIFKL